MTEFTLKTITDPARAFWRGVREAIPFCIAFALGAAFALAVLASDGGSHLILTERDCHIQHSFVADGVRYYCAPWIEVAP